MQIIFVNRINWCIYSIKRISKRNSEFNTHVLFFFLLTPNCCAKDASTILRDFLHIFRFIAIEIVEWRCLNLRKALNWLFSNEIDKNFIQIFAWKIAWQVIWTHDSFQGPTSNVNVITVLQNFYIYSKIWVRTIFHCVCIKNLKLYDIFRCICVSVLKSLFDLPQIEHGQNEHCIDNENKRHITVNNLSLLTYTDPQRHQVCLKL